MDFYAADIEWWLAEARANPDVAASLIEQLAERVSQLQADADALRVETLTLKRGGPGNAAELARAKAELRELRQTIESNGLNDRVLVWTSFTGDALQTRAGASNGQLLVNGDVRDIKPIYVSGARRLDHLFAVTSSFRGLLYSNLSLPMREVADWRLAQPLPGLSLRRGERIEAVCAHEDFERANNVVVVTRLGWVRVLPWSQAQDLADASHPLFAPHLENDTPVWVSASSRADLLVVTRLGKWSRFPLVGVDTLGADAIQRDTGDELTCAAEIGADALWVVFVADTGALVRLAPTSLIAHKKPGAKPEPLPRGFRPIACFAARRDGSLITLANDGALEVTPLETIPVSESLGEAKPFSLLSQRLIAASLMP